MLNVGDEKKKEKEMNNNICQNKKLNAYLYTILQWSTFLKRCLPNPRNNKSQVSRNQTLYVTTNSSHQDNYQKEKNMAH